MKNILVVNRMHTDNLGDRLIGESLARAARDFGNVSRLEYVGLFPQLSRFGFFGSLLSVTLQLFRLQGARPDVILIGGGQLLLPTNRFFGSLVGWWLVSWLLGCRVVLFAVGTEGNWPTLKRWVFRFIQNDFFKIFLRDALSLSSLSFLHRGDARVVPDVVFSNTGVKRGARGEGLYVCLAGFSSSVAKYKNGLTREKYFRQACDYISASIERDERIVLFSSCRSDMREINEFRLVVQNEFRSSKVDLWLPVEVNEFTERLSEARVVISSRMHPLIVAQMAGARVVPIIRNGKLKEYRDAVVPLGCCDLRARVLDALRESVATLEVRSFEGGI
jgi:polysaccharide pyruvyl transferase WcaK-like protein